MLRRSQEEYTVKKENESESIGPERQEAPEFKGLLPDLDPGEYAALKADIAMRGVQVPIEFDQHRGVVEGHHRLRAHEELRAEGVNLPDYPRVVRSFDTNEEMVEHALALNLLRRHLSAEARRDVEATLRSWDWSNRKIAEMLGTSEITVRRDLKGATNVAPDFVKGKDGRKYPTKSRPSIVVHNARDQQRASEVFEALGEDAPKGFQQLRRAEARAREACMERRRTSPVPNVSDGAGWRIEHCDFRELATADHSVDAIVCDPPYTKDDIPIFSELSEFAKRVLKPGHPLITYIGKHYLPEEIARLAEHLEFVWIGATVFRGRQTRDDRLKINGSHRPWLVFSAGPYQPRSWIKDTLDVKEGTGEKGLQDHPWQQAEEPFRRLISMVTEPGELVLDPFLGSGTTAAAAIATGRRIAGCDVDAAAVSMTLERLETSP
jgi:ParB-like chromosome segregation protein Spo0J